MSELAGILLFIVALGVMWLGWYVLNTSDEPGCDDVYGKCEKHPWK